jgi:hypothetical protein
MTALMSESIGELMSSLLAAKKKFKPAVKDSENPHFHSKFVSLTGVLDAVEGALLDNDILLSQPIDVIDGKNVLVSRLMHVSGQWMASYYQLNPVKSDPQAEGSALTYARRYAAMALLGIAPEDDDGEAASRAQQRQRSEPVDTPEAAPSASDWAQFIAGASTANELNDIARRLAASPLSPAARKPLKETWSARMNELQGTPA